MTLPPNLPELRYNPCGGCGAANPRERCIGCFHDFGHGERIETPWVVKQEEALREPAPDSLLQQEELPAEFAEAMTEYASTEPTPICPKCNNTGRKHPQLVMESLFES